jgi:TRAP transporter TAXI family solute receptor
MATIPGRGAMLALPVNEQNIRRERAMLKRIFTTLAAVALFGMSTSSAWSQVKDIRWGTGPVGSAGYKALVVLADLLNREMPNYRITVLPTPGAVTTIKGYSTGEYDAIYGSDVAFHELADDSGRFKGFKAQMKRQPVQSFWTFTLEPGLAIKASNRDKIKSWSDLAGKRVFTGPLPFDTRAQIDRALDALGVKFDYVQVDLSTAGSQLQSGGIDAMCIYTSAEATPPPWLTEASFATDWAVLNPSAEEIATLKKQNFQITELRPDVFKRDIHADKAVLLPFFFGFDVGLDVPADDVYRMLKIIEKNAGELAKSDSSFTQIAKDMPNLERRGVESSWNLVPIHPGLAKYMREKGVWNPRWDTKVAGK